MGWREHFLARHTISEPYRTGDRGGLLPKPPVVKGNDYQGETGTTWVRLHIAYRTQHHHPSADAAGGPDRHSRGHREGRGRLHGLHQRSVEGRAIFYEMRISMDGS